MSTAVSTLVWSLRRRLLVGLGGALFGFAALVLGATTLAQYESSRQEGALVAFIVIASAPLGLYGLAAASWGHWAPGTDLRRRVRVVRVASGWALLIGFYLLMALPLFGTMTLFAWEAFARLTFIVVSAACGLFVPLRAPKLTAILLVVAAVTATVVPFRILTTIVSDAGVILGPGMTLSFLMAGSLWLALVAAAILAWPIRLVSFPSSA
jgi:hypothetical protein